MLQGAKVGALNAICRGAFAERATPPPLLKHPVLTPALCPRARAAAGHQGGAHQQGAV